MGVLHRKNYESSGPCNQLKKRDLSYLLLAFLSLTACSLSSIVLISPLSRPVLFRPLASGLLSVALSLFYFPVFLFSAVSSPLLAPSLDLGFHPLESPSFFDSSTFRIRFLFRAPSNSYTDRGNVGPCRADLRPPARPRDAQTWRPGVVAVVPTASRVSLRPRPASA